MNTLTGIHKENKNIYNIRIEKSTHLYYGINGDIWVTETDV